MYLRFKRCFDFVSSLTLLLIISPLFLILCLLVRINLGGPVFFTQERSGKDKKKFALIKFRTMTDERDENGNLKPDDLRVTRFGKWLRSSSLDELPELLCIIKGDMSVIGPRPLPIAYDNFYFPKEQKRFNVRGGLIPPDSVDESSIITWDRQFEYEAEYAENLCFQKDAAILFSVVKTVFQREKVGYGSYVRKPLDEERANMKEVTK